MRAPRTRRSSAAVSSVEALLTMTTSYAARLFCKIEWRQRSVNSARL
jgi:hypothetical protein